MAATSLNVTDRTFGGQSIGIHGAGGHALGGVDSQVDG